MRRHLEDREKKEKRHTLSFGDLALLRRRRSCHVDRSRGGAILSRRRVRGGPVTMVVTRCGRSHGAVRFQDVGGSCDDGRW